MYMYLRIKIWFFDFYRVMKPADGAKIPWSQKIKFNSYIYTSFLDPFLCINCEDLELLVQNTLRRKVIKRRFRP